MTTHATYRLSTDPWTPSAVLANARLGTLTTDHAASNYGLPVLVGDDGVARGPADIEDGTIQLGRDGLTDTEYDAIRAAAASAGFRVC